MRSLIRLVMVAVILSAGCVPLETRAIDQACDGFLTVDQLNTAIHGLAAEYIDGVPYSAQIYAVQEFCGGYGDCQNCLFALVDVVYSQ